MQGPVSQLTLRVRAVYWPCNWRWMRFVKENAMQHWWLVRMSLWPRRPPCSSIVWPCCRRKESVNHSTPMVRNGCRTCSRCSITPKLSPLQETDTYALKVSALSLYKKHPTLVVHIVLSSTLKVVPTVTKVKVGFRILFFCMRVIDS